MKITTKQLVWSYRAIANLILVGILFYDVKLAGNLLLSCLQSESSIGMWMTRGWTPRAATTIGVMLGDFADFNWWLIVFYDMEQSPRIKRFFGAFWKIEPTEADLKTWRYRLRYVALPIMSLLPDGGVWASLIAAKFLRLNKWATLALILAGNTAKNAAWGKLFSLMGKNSSYAAIALLLSAILIMAIGAIRKFKNGRAAIMPASPASLPEFEPED